MAEPKKNIDARNPLSKAFKIRILIYPMLLLAGLIFFRQEVETAYRFTVNAWLRSSIKHDDINWAKNLLAVGADKKIVKTMLITAVEKGDTKRAAQALALGADPNQRAAKTDPVLFWAAYHNHIDCAALLLENGANPDYITKRDWSILSMAIHQRNNAIANMLIDHGADIQIQGKRLERTPLWVAVKKDNLEILERLLEKGVKTRMWREKNPAKDQNGNPRKYSLLSEAMWHGHNEAAILLVEGCDGHRIGDDLLKDVSWLRNNTCRIGIQRAITRRKYENFELPYANPINTAIQQGESTAGIKTLIAQYPDQVNRQAETGLTPLIAAIDAGRQDVVEALIAREADVDQVDNDGFPPLAIAASQKHYPIFRQLVRAGADIRSWACSDPIETHPGDNFYTYVVRTDDIEAMKILKDERADINLGRGNTVPLAQALWGPGKEALVKLMLEAGADPYWNDSSPGKVATPLRTELEAFQPFLKAAYPSYASLRKLERKLPLILDKDPDAPVRVHVLSVDHGTRKDGLSRIPVTLSDERAPLLLILNASAPIEWQVRAETGVNLKKIWVFGHRQSRVTGLPHQLKDVAIEIIARPLVKCFHITHKNELMDVAQAVANLTGLRPATCQSARQGEFFSIDGFKTIHPTYRIAELPPKWPVRLKADRYSMLAEDKLSYLHDGKRAIARAWATMVYNTGKWYFEARFRKGDRASVFGPGTDAGLYYAHHEHPEFNGRTALDQSFALGLPKGIRDRLEDNYLIGVALDLDGGRLYFRDAQGWVNGDPNDNATGRRIQIGRAYRAGIAIAGETRGEGGNRASVNFGAAAFEYPLPPGYFSYDGNQRGPVAPSFNCDAAQDMVENTICQDNHLARLDVGLDHVYRRLKLRTSFRQQADLVERQRQWLAERDTACRQADPHGRRNCLVSMYENRIEALFSKF